MSFTLQLFLFPLVSLTLLKCFFFLFLQDEKAEGLVNVASYSIESAGEHKRK